MPVGARQRRDEHGIVALRLASPKARAACGVCCTCGHSVRFLDLMAASSVLAAANIRTIAAATSGKRCGSTMVGCSGQTIRMTPGCAVHTTADIGVPMKNLIADVTQSSQKSTFIVVVALALVVGRAL
jgi:hypothetical protein